MSVDLYAIADALRDTFHDVTAPTGTRGGTVIRGSSVGIDSVNVTPYILVEAPNGEVQTAMGVFPRRMDHEFQVYFLFDAQVPDVPRNTAVMLKWLGPLLDTLDTDNLLSLGPGIEDGWNVKSTQILGYDPTPLEVGGTPYYAWHFRVQVTTQQHTAPTP